MNTSYYLGQSSYLGRNIYTLLCEKLLHKELVLGQPSSLQKTVGTVSRILVTSRSDSDFERSNVNLKEKKPDGVNPNSIACITEQTHEIRVYDLCNGATFAVPHNFA